MTTVVRTHHALGRRNGLTTLEQRFRFEGDGARAVAIARPDTAVTALMT